MASDDLDIRSGGIVAVDTETLRAAVARLVAEGVACEELRASLDRARRLVSAEGVWFAPPTGAAVDAGERSRRLAHDLQAMANTYEVAELASAAAIAEAAGDADLAASLRGRAAEILVADPAAIAKLAALAVHWRGQNVTALIGQYSAPGIPGAPSPFDAGGLMVVATTLISIIGRGTVEQGARLGGTGDPVRIARRGEGRTTAPISLTQVVDRIPQGENRVRVERYTLPSGERQFMVYATGTAGLGVREVANWRANTDLYLGRGRAASFEATMAALADAGARPGETVNVAGYSQGAAVASFIALDDTYDVRMLITFGDPVQADVGADTLSVAVRHNDDPVSALADGGFAAGVGAEGSFVASRETPGTAWTGQGPIGSHLLDTYRETAGMLDTSSDPRMDGVRERWQALAQATSVEVFVYEATRGTGESVDVGAPAVPGAPGVPGVGGTPAAPWPRSGGGVSSGASADAG